MGEANKHDDAMPGTPEEVVVSLTSFPAAIGFVRPVVESLLRGSVLPDRIVLYVTMAQFGPEGLPAELTALAGRSKYL